MNCIIRSMFLAKPDIGIGLGKHTIVDMMISDGLWDAFGEYNMGITAENIAEK